MYLKMAANYDALLEGPAMSPPLVPPNSSTPRRPVREETDSMSLAREEDFAIGCECADPALQIDDWGRDASAQPLQEFY